MDQSTLISFLPLVGIMVIFYFLLIRPQQKQQKARKAMLSDLRKGDKIVTIGGIHGLIKEIREDDMVIVRIADNTNIKLARFGVGDVQRDEEEESAE